MGNRVGVVRLRCHVTEKEAWEAAAGGARLLSDWIRRTLNEKLASLEADSGRIPAAKVDGGGSSPAPTTPSSSRTCPRRHLHRPGSYCKSCGHTI